MVFERSKFYEDLDTMVQAAAYDVLATTSSNSPYYLLQLAFGCNIIFCQQVLIDWDHLKQLHQFEAEITMQKKMKNVKSTATL